MFNHQFGIEIEAFDIPSDQVADLLNASGLTARCRGYNHDTTFYWKVVSDSSIRGNNSFELVSPVLRGTAGLGQVEQAMTVLENAQAKVNKTCGLHVHFDASGWSETNYRVVTRNYAALEPLLDLMMPNSRRSSNNNYLRSLIGVSYSSIWDSRYYKLNLQSTRRHGTLEFRQHSGTIEHRKAIPWIRLCARILDLSQAGVIIPSDCDVYELFDVLFNHPLPAPNQSQPPLPTTLVGLKAEVYRLLGIDPGDRWASTHVRRYADQHNLANPNTCSLLSSAGWREVLVHIHTTLPATVATVRPALSDVSYWIDRITTLDATIRDSRAAYLLDKLQQQGSRLAA